MFAGIGFVDAAKVALMLPPGMVIDAGTVTAGFVEESVTTVPALGALPQSMTVHVLAEPPVTVPGVHCTEDGEAAVIASDAVCVDPL